MRIGFIGLGRMGAGMAANLLRAGHELAVWNRSADKAQPLLELGAKAASSPRDAATGCEVTITMLADDAALDAVLHGDKGLVAGLPCGALHISMSTIAPPTAGRAAALHGEAGQRYVSAPVFGRPEAAAAAKLFIVAAGVAADLAAAKSLFEALGQRTFQVCEKPEAANLVKLCGNFLIFSAVEAMAEAMALGQKGGVAKSTLLEVLTGSLFDAPVYRNYGAMLAEGRYRPAGFAAPLAHKDMRLLGQQAENLRVPMPLLSLLRDRLLETMGSAGEDIDWSGLGAVVDRNAGLPGQD
jgi:3-hydroxyisobutyrate dehydrogenase-like beta-hydroxyacid dehydrogenase